MPKHFKYRSLEELQKEIYTLGLQDDVQLTDDLSPLWHPIQFGDRTIGNRLSINPMEGCDGTPDGGPDEFVYRRWKRFGEGGAKMIWGEATAVLEEARANKRQLWIHDGNASDFEDLLKQTRSAHRERFGDDRDLVVGLQLTHSGRYSYRMPLLAFHDPAADPVTLVDKKKKLPVTDDYPVLTDSYLERLEDEFTAAAVLVWKAGFDFVDVKQCHRYLLS
ncbi:uncharacterized protein METZ01_LOCUS475484, partial [marine metagenome]